MSDLSTAARIVEEAIGRGLKIAVAESLTGGLLSDALVTVPGTSAVFTGAVVAYDTEVKRLLLGVDRALLDEQGPVHPDVAKQMAAGVRRVCGIGEATEIGVATTGVAGPDPDPQTGQSPGTVWIGVSTDDGERAVSLMIPSNASRGSIRQHAVESALEVLWETITS